MKQTSLFVASVLGFGPLFSLISVQILFRFACLVTCTRSCSLVQKRKQENTKKVFLDIVHCLVAAAMFNIYYFTEHVTLLVMFLKLSLIITNTTLSKYMEQSHNSKGQAQRANKEHCWASFL